MNRPGFVSKFLRLLTAAALPACGTLAAAEPDLSAQITAQIRAITDKCGEAICRVEAGDDHGRLSGTAFLVDADGTLLTTYSVGGETDDIVVTIGTDKYPATRLLADARSGLAILKVDATKPLPFLSCAKPQETGLSAPVIVLGHPLALPLSPSLGMVAGFDIGFRGRFFATRHIRISVPVQRGQSGSPVLNFNGDLIGILIGTVGEQNGIFALPIDAASKVLRDFRTSGRVRQGWLGADVRVTEAPEHGSNARIRDVRKDSPGFTGGLRPGDVILGVGDRKIANPEDVLSASFFIVADEPLKIRISRAAKIHDLTVTPADSPDGEGPTVQREDPPFLGATGVTPAK